MNAARHLADSAHQVPSASALVRLSILNIPGHEYAMARSKHLRISLNIGPSFRTRMLGPGADGILLCQRNGLLITPPDLALRHRSSDLEGFELSTKPTRLVVFVMSLELLAACCIERGIRSSDFVLTHRALLPSGPALTLAQALLADLSEGSPDGAGETEFLAKALLARIARQLRPRPVEAVVEDPIARVRHHIESNLPSALPLSELASIAGLSQYHFCRQFRDATGKSPHQFVLGARVEAARQMLWRSGMVGEASKSILDIALACGFGSSSHFSTQFKRHTGQSPLQWKAGHR